MKSINNITYVHMCTVTVDIDIASGACGCDRACEQAQYAPYFSFSALTDTLMNTILQVK